MYTIAPSSMPHMFLGIGGAGDALCLLPRPFAWRVRTDAEQLSSLSPAAGAQAETHELVVKVSLFDPNYHTLLLPKDVAKRSVGLLENLFGIAMGELAGRFKVSPPL